MTFQSTLSFFGLSRPGTASAGKPAWIAVLSRVSPANPEAAALAADLADLAATRRAARAGAGIIAVSTEILSDLR